MNPKTNPNDLTLYYNDIFPYAKLLCVVWNDRKLKERNCKRKKGVEKGQFHLIRRGEKTSKEKKKKL